MRIMRTLPTDTGIPTTIPKLSGSGVGHGVGADVSFTPNILLFSNMYRSYLNFEDWSLDASVNALLNALLKTKKKIKIKLFILLILCSSEGTE